MSKKKVIGIILFIFSVFGLAYLLYFVFFKPKVPVTPPPEKPTVIKPAKLPVTKEKWEKMTYQERKKAGLPVYQWPEKKEIFPELKPEVLEIDKVAKGRKTFVNPVSSDFVSGATISADGLTSIYYNKSDGRFYQIDENGRKRLLSEKVFYNVKDIKWSPTKDKAIIEYPDGFKIVYDFQREKQYSLPKNWSDFSWNSTGSMFAFKSIGRHPENNWLSIALPDGTRARAIEPMGENADKVIVSWSPNNQVIAFSETAEPKGTWTHEVLLIGLHGENFKSLVVDGRRFEPKWSPKGDKIIYSVYSPKTDFKPNLYIVNAQSDEIGTGLIDTGLKTWASKCTFNSSGTVLYCAVPKNLPEGAGMLPELAKDTSDDFYKIDVLTGEKMLLAETAFGEYNVKEIYLSSDETKLYFVDGNTGQLSFIRLK